VSNPTLAEKALKILKDHSKHYTPQERFQQMVDSGLIHPDGSYPGPRYTSTMTTKQAWKIIKKFVKQHEVPCSIHYMDLPLKEAGDEVGYWLVELNTPECEYEARAKTLNGAVRDLAVQIESDS
jgi:hypothetical protein